MESWLEKKFNTIAEASMAQSLAYHYCDKVQVIYNGFDEEDYAALPEQSTFPDSRTICIVYICGTGHPSVFASIPSKKTLELTASHFPIHYNRCIQ